MPAFTEMTEMFIMKTKNSEKRALFSIKYSRGALSIVDKIENWKNTKKKTTSVEVKLHAALVLNMTVSRNGLLYRIKFAQTIACCLQEQ